MQSMKPAIVALAAALALQGCAKQGEDPAKVKADVAKAQAEGNEKIAAAQEVLERARSVANAAPVNPDDAGATTGTPPASVDAPGTTMVAIDPAKRLADAQSEVEKAKAEQIYNVSLARCEDRVGDANKACRDLAKSIYDSAVDAAKSKAQTPPPKAKGDS